MARQHNRTQPAIGDTLVDTFDGGVWYVINIDDDVLYLSQNPNDWHMILPIDASAIGRAYRLVIRNKAIVVTKSAKMPSSVKARYKRIGVLIVAHGDHSEPHMISERCRSVISVAETYERLHWGGPRSAYAVALRDAQISASKLNIRLDRNYRRRLAYALNQVRSALTH